MTDFLEGILSTVGNLTLIIGVGLIFLGFLFFFLARIIFWITLAAGVLLAFAVTFIVYSFLGTWLPIPGLCYVGILLGIIIGSFLYALAAEIMLMMNAIGAIGTGYALIFGYNFALMGGMAMGTCVTLWIIATVVTVILAYAAAVALPGSAIAMMKRGVDLKKKPSEAKVEAKRRPGFVGDELYYCTRCGRRHEYSSRIGQDHLQWKREEVQAREDRWERPAPAQKDAWDCPMCGRSFEIREIMRHLSGHVTPLKAKCTSCNIKFPNFIYRCPFCNAFLKRPEGEESGRALSRDKDEVEDGKEPVFCIKCGNRLDPDSSFCIKCGTKTDQECEKID